MPGVDFEDKRQVINVVVICLINKLTDQLMAMISENESLNQRVHFITQEVRPL